MDKDLLKIKEQLRNIDTGEREHIFSIAEDIFKKQIINVGTISYVELFQEATLDMGQYYHALQNGLPVDENVESIYKKLMSYVSELPSILGNFQERITDIKEWRREIIQYIRLLSAYYIECSYIYEIVSEKISVRELEAAGGKTVQLNTFYQDVAKYLAMDVQKVPHKMSYILSVLPFRLTKQYFLGRVSEILERVKKDSPANGWAMILQRYKELFDGSNYGLYGEKFVKFHEKIEHLKVTDFRKSTTEDLKSVQRETELMLNNLSMLIQTFQSYGSIANRILVMHMMEFKDFERVLEGDVVIPDIYKRFTELKWLVEKEKDETTSRGLEELYEICRERGKELYQQTNALGELFNLCMDKLPSGLGHGMDEYITLSQKIMAITNDYEHEDYEDIFMPVGDGAGQDHSIESFIQCLEESLLKMTTDMRRSKMKKLLSVLPVPFTSPEEFFEYMKSSLEFNTTDAEKAWAVDHIYKMMVMNGEKN